MARRCNADLKMWEFENLEMKVFLVVYFVSLIHSVSGQALPDGCTGGRPDKSVINKAIFPQSKFHYANRTSYNDITTSKGDHISIEYSNCDYATYRFTVSSDYISSMDTADWIRQAANIIKEIKPGLKLVVQLDSALIYLHKICSSQLPRFNEELIFRHNAEAQWREVVMVNLTERRQRRTTVTITVYEGPL